MGLGEVGAGLAARACRTPRGCETGAHVRLDVPCPDRI